MKASEIHFTNIINAVTVFFQKHTFYSFPNCFHISGNCLGESCLLIQIYVYHQGKSLGVTFVATPTQKFTTDLAKTC
jgi:hypothetical protein